jgi:deoxyribonucleoside regulator
LGVTWGNTVYHVVHHLEPVLVKDLVLVQIGGGLGTIEGMDNNTLTMTLGQKLGAKAHVIPAPVIVRTREIRDTLFKEKKIQETLAIARKADLVLFGLGIIGPDGLLWKSGFLTKADAAKLKESGAVGAVCGRFFDASGKQCWNDVDDRTIGLNLDEFRRIKHKICVVTGKEKSEIIRAALKGKLLDVLITDDATAAGLLAEKKNDRNRKLTSRTAVAKRGIFRQSGKG